MLIVNGPDIWCLTDAWTNADAVCPTGYVLTWWWCNWACVWIEHPNSYPIDSSTYRCSRWTTWVQDTRVLKSKAICTKIKQ